MFRTGGWGVGWGGAQTISASAMTANTPVHRPVGAILEVIRPLPVSRFSVIVCEILDSVTIWQSCDLLKLSCLADRQSSTTRGKLPKRKQVPAVDIAALGSLTQTSPAYLLFKLNSSVQLQRSKQIRYRRKAFGGRHMHFL